MQALTPEQRIKREILLQWNEQPREENDEPYWFSASPHSTGEEVDALFDELQEEWRLSDLLSEFREGEIETNVQAECSRHYESRSVAAKLCDGGYVGWTYWYGGGKHGEPEAIDWMCDAYDLDQPRGPVVHMKLDPPIYFNVGVSLQSPTKALHESAYRTKRHRKIEKRSKRGSRFRGATGCYVTRKELPKETSCRRLKARARAKLTRAMQLMYRKAVPLFRSWHWDYLWRLEDEGMVLDWGPPRALPRALNMQDAVRLYRKFNEFEDQLPTPGLP